MAEENEWRRSIEEALSGLNESLQHLRVQHQQQQEQQEQSQQPQPQRHDEDRFLGDTKKHPQRFHRGDDPSIYVMHFEAIANHNRWDGHQRARAFPTYLEPSVLQWYSSLGANAKQDYTRLKDAFIRRYQGANDRHKMEQDFANIRFNRYTTLEAYTDQLEDLGARLGKTQDEVIKKFIVGLPDAVYRWVNNLLITDLGDALEQAHQGLVLFPPRQGRYNPREDATPPPRHAPEQWNRRPRSEDTFHGQPNTQPRRQEEPMEFRQRYHGRGQTYYRQPDHARPRGRGPPPRPPQ